MMHSNLTRWIEDADARNALLQGEMKVCQFQENAQKQCIHLGPAVKAVASWWHHSVVEHLQVASTSHH